MFNTEKLIHEVRIRDNLWNCKSKRYLDRVARRTAWEEIAQVFHRDWEDFTPAEKGETVEKLMRKWRNVRDYYIKEKKRSVKSKFPGGLEPMFENPNYQIATMLFTAGVIFTCYVPANITTFLIVVTGYIEAQMLSLTEELLHLWEDAEEHYCKTKQASSLLDNNKKELGLKNKAMNDYVEEHLKEIITTHGKNINLLHQVQKVFSGAIALEFFLLVVGLIAELLGGLENTYMEIPFALMQVGMDCLTGQRVMDASVKFERAVYDSKWENYNISNKKIILTMLQNSQKTMKLSAGGIIMLSSSCFMQVIKSIYSAYTTLRSTMK